MWALRTALWTSFVLAAACVDPRRCSTEGQCLVGERCDTSVGFCVLAQDGGPADSALCEQVECPEESECRADSGAGPACELRFQEIVLAPGDAGPHGAAVDLLLTAELRVRPGFARVGFPRELPFYVSPSGTFESGQLASDGRGGSYSGRVVGVAPTGQDSSWTVHVEAFDGGLHADTFFRTDTRPPVVTVTVAAAPGRPYEPGIGVVDPHPDYSSAYKRVEEAVVRVTADEPIDVGPGSFASPLDAVATERWTCPQELPCGDEPTCRCFGLKLWRLPMPAFRGVFQVRLERASDAAGNAAASVDAGTELRVTRWGWARDVGPRGPGQRPLAPVVAGTSGVVLVAHGPPAPGGVPLTALRQTGERLAGFTAPGLAGAEVTAPPVAAASAFLLALRRGDAGMLTSLSPRSGGVVNEHCIEPGGGYEQPLVLGDLSVDGGALETVFGPVSHAAAPEARVRAWVRTTTLGDACHDVAVVRSEGGRWALQVAGGRGAVYAVASDRDPSSVPADLRSFSVHRLGWSRDALDGGTGPWLAAEHRVHARTRMWADSLALSGAHLVIGASISADASLGLALSPHAGSSTTFHVASSVTAPRWTAPLVLGLARLASGGRLDVLHVPATGGGHIGRAVMSLDFSHPPSASSDGAFAEPGWFSAPAPVRWDLDAVVRAAPLLGTGGLMYVGQESGELSVLDVASTNTVWALEGGVHGIGGPVDGPVNIDVLRDATGQRLCGAVGRGGILYVPSTMAGRLYAMYVDSEGIDATAPWPRFRHDPANTGNPDRSLAEWTCP